MAESCRAMARYNRWMNAKVYGSAALLSDEERSAIAVPSSSPSTVS
jgi:uncharacterized damage-inducible protein DinB